jgi:superoxide dismutase, Fe-Mn family
MQLKLPKLPFDFNALKDLFSQEAIDLHYNRHHRGYVNKANQLLKNTKQFDYIVDLLENIPEGNPFNNVAQAWNHCFLWNSLAKAEDSKIQFDRLVPRTKSQLQKLRDDFVQQSVAHFGSGWCWIVADQNQKLSVTTTHDGQVPFLRGHRPLITCDLWEHAYYVDYRNDRERFVKSFWKHVHWDFLQKNLQETTIPNLGLLALGPVRPPAQKRQYHSQTFVS